MIHELKTKFKHTFYSLLEFREITDHVKDDAKFFLKTKSGSEEILVPLKTLQKLDDKIVLSE